MNSTPQTHPSKAAIRLEPFTLLCGKPGCDREANTIHLFDDSVVADAGPIRVMSAAEFMAMEDFPPEPAAVLRILAACPAHDPGGYCVELNGDAGLWDEGRFGWNDWAEHLSEKPGNWWDPLLRWLRERQVMTSSENAAKVDPSVEWEDTTRVLVDADTCSFCGVPGHHSNCKIEWKKLAAAARNKGETLMPIPATATCPWCRVAGTHADTCPVKPAPKATEYDLSSVEPELVDWLWLGHVPLGKLTVYDGNPGLGKSALTLDLAARVTTGREMPDGSPGMPTANVLILTAEDGIADTIRPRAEAAGADCSRIQIIEDIPDPDGGHMPAIPGDIVALEEVITRRGIKLLVIDPLSAYFGSEIDARSDSKVRRSLSPLAKMAERCGCAVILIRHLTKATDRIALHRGMDSVGIIGAARAGFLIGQDTEGADNERVIAPTKFNLGSMPDSLKFRTVNVELSSGINTVGIEWRGRSLQTADSLLAEPANPEKLQEALDFIEVQLTGAKVEAATMLKRAEAAGINEKTLRRAKAKLGVESGKNGPIDGWFWQLPQATEADS